MFVGFVKIIFLILCVGRFHCEVDGYAKDPGPYKKSPDFDGALLHHIQSSIIDAFAVAIAMTIDQMIATSAAAADLNACDCFRCSDTFIYASVVVLVGVQHILTKYLDSIPVPPTFDRFGAMQFWRLAWWCGAFCGSWMRTIML